MAKTRTVTDQMGREVTYTFPPQRIVSLVPSQTELLYHLGLSDEVVGQTLFCVHPEQMHKTKPRIGGTKNFNIDKIAALKPDLIIGNKEENEKSRIEELEKLFPVWMSNIETLNDSMEMISQVGSVVNKEENANATVALIRSGFDDLHSLNDTKNTAYLIWRKPWMGAGHDTFITHLLNRIGLKNVFAHKESRYPEISESEFKNSNIQVILLSSEPYPFKEKHIEELKAICPDAVIRLVDGELFSWYGSRLLYSAGYLKQLLQDLDNA